MLIKANPDVPEAKHLRIWSDAGGRRSPLVQQESSAVLWKSIGQIEREQLGRAGRPDYITIKGMCMHIANDRVVYMVGVSIPLVTDHLRTLLELFLAGLFAESDETLLGTVPMRQVWEGGQCPSLVVHATRKSLAESRDGRVTSGSLGGTGRFHGFDLGDVLLGTSARTDGEDQRWAICSSQRGGEARELCSRGRTICCFSRMMRFSCRPISIRIVFANESSVSGSTKKPSM